MSLVFRNFSEAYVELVQQVYEGFSFECAPRGQKIRERLAVSFTIQDPRNRLLYVPERKFSLAYVMAEILWYMLANDKTAWIENYSSMWGKISDDGTTANSAYGSRIFKPHCRVANGTFTQWDFVKEELQRDPDSRRAVIHIRTPDDSVQAKLDVPCTLTLQFFIRDKRLYLVVNMRSTDLIFGLGNDVPAFTFMQEVMAYELGVELGSYIHVSNSLHVYERHFEMCQRILEEKTHSVSPLPMPKITSNMPVAILDMGQAWMRELLTAPEIKKALDTCLQRISDSLWRDWARVLAVHRLQKLASSFKDDPGSFSVVAAEVIASLEFEGFKGLL